MKLTNLFNNLRINNRTSQNESSAGRSEQPPAAGRTAPPAASRPAATRPTARPAWATTGMSSGTTTIRPADLLAHNLQLLNDWAREGPPAERDERHEVAEVFRKCWKSSRSEPAIDIEGFTLITSLPPIPPKLTGLRLSKLHALAETPDLSQCHNLRRLELENCVNLCDPVILRNAGNLQAARIDGCVSMSPAPDLTHCTKLKQLVLNNFLRAGIPAPDLSQCRQLELLHMQYWMQSLTPPDLSANTRLREVDFEGCLQWRQPPDLSNCRHL
jgi:hypothetical protein